mmetsp:Transcript_37205/g.104983  ORF Transcript_37205/g.104983 Transcript_37205/m.104983 type:complete len:252 (-) Transcript_37205:271-1026(-)
MKHMYLPLEAPPQLADKCIEYEQGSVVWDGAVCLADFLTHPPAVLTSHHHRLARSSNAEAWQWKDKTVVELGAGLGLISCTAAILGAKHVICTDGDGSTLKMADVNVSMLAAEHSSACPVGVQLLQWGTGREGDLGLQLPVDVVVASDVLYVLENPGAWGALLRTLLALAGPDTLVLLTYTDRGHGKLFRKFVKRAAVDFHLVEVSPHLLHPTSDPAASDRIERTSGTVQIFCLSLRDKPTAAPMEAGAAA